MNKMYLSEWKLSLKSFAFISIDVILLSNNKRAIARQNVNAYIKALEMYLTYNFQTNAPLGWFV